MSVLEDSRAQPVTADDMFDVAAPAPATMEAPAAGAVEAQPEVMAITADSLQKLQVRASDRITRRLATPIEGSFEEWDKSGAKWVMTEADLDALRRSGRHAADGKRSGNMQKVIPLTVKMLYKGNYTPVDVGFKITGVKGNVYGRGMQRWASVAFADQVSGEAETVHTPDSYVMESAELLNEYGSLTSEDLDKGIMVDIDDEAISYVKPDSTVGKIIKENADKLGVNWASHMKSLRLNKYLMVRTEIVDHIKSTVKDEVLAKRPYEDYTAFEVEMVRQDGRKFCDPMGWRCDASSKALIAAVCKAPRSVPLLLSLDFVIHDSK